MLCLIFYVILSGKLKNLQPSPDFQALHRPTWALIVIFFLLEQMNIYVGNLPYGVADEDLREIFSQYGDIDKAKVIMDRESGRSKGFGFVEMTNDAEAEEAVQGLDGFMVQGRSLKVNVARPRENGPRH